MEQVKLDMYTLWPTPTLANDLKEKDKMYSYRYSNFQK